MGLTSRIVCDGSAAGRQVQLSVSGQWRGHGRSACTPRRTRIASRAWHDQLANTNWPKRGCRNGPSLLLQGRAVCVCSQRAPSACSFNLFIFRFWQEQRSVLAGQLERSWSLSTTVTRGVLLYLHFFFWFWMLVLRASFRTMLRIFPFSRPLDESLLCAVTSHVLFPLLRGGVEPVNWP